MCRRWNPSELSKTMTANNNIYNIIHKRYIQCVYVHATHIVTHRKMHSHNIIIYTTRFPTYTIFRSRGWEMKKIIHAFYPWHLCTAKTHIFTAYRGRSCALAHNNIFSVRRKNWIRPYYYNITSCNAVDYCPTLSGKKNEQIL